MKLSFTERLLINSPLRGLSLSMLEPCIFNKLAPFPHGAHILDIGCGNGTGLQTLASRYAPASLTGLDIDESQLRRARRRLGRAGINAQLVQANATQIPLPAHTYDVVTCNGCLHHIAGWQMALNEVSRLLRHGGLFYMLEFYRPLLRVLRFITPHPKNRFTHEQLLRELSLHGFTVLAHKNIFNIMGFIVARRTGNAPQYD